MEIDKQSSGKEFVGQSSETPLYPGDDSPFSGYSPRRHVLDVLINSKTRVRVLELLFFDPNTGIHLREIARRVGQEINAVRTELSKLEEAEFVKSAVQGNRKFYQPNEQSPGYQILHSLFTVTQEELTAMGLSHLESEEMESPEITLDRNTHQLKINSAHLPLTTLEFALVEHLDNYRGVRFTTKVLTRIAQAEGYNGDPAGILHRIEYRTMANIFVQTVEGEETLWSLSAAEQPDRLQRAVPPSRLSTLNLILDDPNATPEDIIKELGRTRNGISHTKQQAKRALMNTVWRLFAFRAPNSHYGKVILNPQEAATIDKAQAFMNENKMNIQAWGKFRDWVLSRLEMKRYAGLIEPISNGEAAALGSILFLRGELIEHYGIPQLPFDAAGNLVPRFDNLNLDAKQIAPLINRGLRKVRAIMASDRLDEIFDMQNTDTQTLLTYFTLVELEDNFKFFKDILSWPRDASFVETDADHEARNRMLLQNAISTPQSN